MSVGVCLTVGAALVATLPVQAFTLAWTHSIEKVRWEEDWRVAGGALQLVEARVRGTGAGMEPPPGAQLRDGVYHYKPKLGVLPRLRLARSNAVSDYQICFAGGCRPLAAYLPESDNASVVELTACHVP